MQKTDPNTDQTHFGYQTIEKHHKAEKVADVFHSVANRYDLMNDLMSFGLHRLWKRIAVEFTGVRTGHQVLDLAGGTGDLTAKLLKYVGDTGTVTLADINASMLNRGRDRLLDRGLLDHVHYCQVDAETLPFADHSFDCVIIGFGLRNVTDQAKALASMYRVIKPGGRVVILEFSKPVLPGLKPLYDAYSFSVLPRLGRWITQDADSYQYLAESIRMHPDQQTLKTLMETAGFAGVTYSNLAGGIVAIHRGYKY